MDHRPLTRRQALVTASMLAAGSAAATKPAAEGTQQATGPLAASTSPRLAPRAELVNVLEYEEQAKRVLVPAVFARIAGGDRAAFDRITLRPRMLVPTIDMDLGVTLFGQPLFAPILAGPIADQQAFHSEAESATAKGASAAKTPLVVSSRTRLPIAALAGMTTSPLWLQVFADDPAAAAQIQDAVKAGCKAICVTVGAEPRSAAARGRITGGQREWDAMTQLRRRSSLPLLVKGISTPQAAALAIQHGADGIIVSTYRPGAGAATDSPILTLPSIVDAVAGKIPVLVDGSFRRGTDILKALAFGAKAVLVGRPVMWGLAAYGADGVQGVLEMLQTELARYMGMCGKPTVGALDRSVVRVHTPPAGPPTGAHRG